MTKYQTEKTKIDVRLRFTPFAWAKQWFLCHVGPTEVGFFALTPNDLSLVEDVWMPDQIASSCHVEFKNLVVDTEEFLKAGMKPEQFMRIWCHTHPGNSPNPSEVDETEWNEKHNFLMDHYFMHIMARDGSNYCRLRIKTPFGTIETKIDASIDWNANFDKATPTAWAEEYKARLTVYIPPMKVDKKIYDGGHDYSALDADWEDWINSTVRKSQDYADVYDELDGMNQEDRNQLATNLGIHVDDLERFGFDYANEMIEAMDEIVYPTDQYTKKMNHDE